MWRNYIVIALRLLARNRAYDSWLSDSGRIYQVQTTIHPPGQPLVRTQTSPYPLREALPAGFPQIETVTSISSGKTVTEHDGQPMFIDWAGVDRDFFKVFD